MQEQGKKYNTPAVCIGKVVKVQPLQIKTGELLLEQDDLFISDLLTSAYKRSAHIVSSDELTSSTQTTSAGKRKLKEHPYCERCWSKRKLIVTDNKFYMLEMSILWKIFWS